MSATELLKRAVLGWLRGERDHWKMVAAPYKGRGADSVKKREPASDIAIAVVDSLKAIDPDRPIRAADIGVSERIACFFPFELHKFNSAVTT